MTDSPKVPVLVVEDNPGDVFLIRRALKHHGLHADITVVQDGQSAIEWMQRAEIDPVIPCPQIILVDLNLPRVTGKRVLERIRASVRCPNVPVVVMTSSDSPLDQEAAAQLRADHYFLKPNDLDRFMQIGLVVRNLLLAAGHPVA